MFKRILSLFLVVFTSSFAQIEGEFRASEPLRILKLLPYLVHPPLVDPYLPDDFTLGLRADDPYFSEGYYWGLKKL